MVLAEGARRRHHETRNAYTAPTSAALLSDVAQEESTGSLPCQTTLHHRARSRQQRQPSARSAVLMWTVWRRLNVPRPSTVSVSTTPCMITVSGLGLSPTAHPSDLTLVVMSSGSSCGQERALATLVPRKFEFPNKVPKRCVVMTDRSNGEEVSTREVGRGLLKRQFPAKSKACRQGERKEEDVKQQKRMEVMRRLARKMRMKGRLAVHCIWRVSK